MRRLNLDGTVDLLERELLEQEALVKKLALENREVFVQKGMSLTHAIRSHLRSGVEVEFLGDSHEGLLGRFASSRSQIDSGN